MKKPLEAIQKYFDTLHGILGIYLTNKCNVTCRHCCVNSGPQEDGKLELEHLVPTIVAGARAGIIKGLHISGGEPFIYLSDVRVLLGHAKELEILAGVNTNVSWAKSRDRAETLLRSLPGLTQLLISTDTYHEDFIPLANVRHAVEAGLSLGLVVQIAVCTPGGRETDFVARLRDCLGERLSGQVDIGLNAVEPVGRGRDLEEANWRKVSRQFPAGRCSQVNRPIILQGGDLFACCNSCVSETCRSSPLNLGNLHYETVAENFEKADKSHILQAIRALGPAFLGNTLVEAGLGGELAGEYGEGDICGLCSDIMSKPSLTKALATILSRHEHQQAIAIARAAVFGETSMLRDLMAARQAGETG